MAVQCEKCGKDHDGSYASGRFCSALCARGFSTAEKREKINRKVSETLKAQHLNEGWRYLLSPEERQRQTAAQKATKLQQLLDADWSTLSVGRKNRRVVIEQDNKCLHCGIDSWRGESLTIQVDHADGDSSNNVRENLRGLCPNCHSQTPTYCGKNRGKHRRKGDYEITDERMLVALLETRSVAAALESLGKKRDGYNYRRCKQLLKQHGLSQIEAGLAKCGFCQRELQDRPHEDSGMKFCDQLCAGKYVGTMRKLFLEGQPKRRLFDIPTIERLKKVLEGHDYRAAGEIFGVSNGTVVGWAKELGLLDIRRNKRVRSAELVQPASAVAS